MRITFLLYCARSGSTHFADQVAKYSADIVVFPECRFFQMLLQMREEQCKTLSPRQIKRLVSSDMQFDNLGFSLDDIDEFSLAAAGKCRRDIVVGLLQRYRDVQGLVGTHFLIKNGQLLHQAKALNEVFPDANFVEITRDPRAVVNSMMTTKTVYSYGGFMAGGDSLTAARLWLRYREAANQLKALRKDNYLRISYERLVTDNDFSQSVVQSISGDSMVGGAGISVSAKESSLHRMAQLPSDQNRSVAWQDELALSEGIAVEVLLGGELIKAGYTTFFTNGISKEQIARVVVTVERRSRRILCKHYLRTIVYWARESLVTPSQVVFRVGEAIRSRCHRRS